MPWRLEITRSIESDTIKSLHATNTTNAAHVGSGFHITFEYRNGARRHVYYRPRQIGYSDSVTTLQFEPSCRPLSMPSPFQPIHLRFITIW